MKRKMDFLSVASLYKSAIYAKCRAVHYDICIKMCIFALEKKENMKKVLYSTLIILLGSMFVSSCDDDETYAEQKEKENKALSSFLKRDVYITGVDGDTICHVGKITPIDEAQFNAQDSTTNLEKNEYVLFKNTGVYMQIVRKGEGQRIKNGESKRILSRFIEYNILGDSLQLRDDVTYWATSPEILNVTNNSGTITASFDTEAGGAMYLTYKSTSVPSGWIVPLKYINLGRYTSDESIAKVRLLVPHSQGTQNATSSVYPCFYEILYQDMRN